MTKAKLPNWMRFALWLDQNGVKWNMGVFIGYLENPDPTSFLRYQLAIDRDVVGQGDSAQEAFLDAAENIAADGYLEFDVTRKSSIKAKF